MRVAICIGTFRRPELLRATLDGVAALKFRTGMPGIEVIVVDNDPSASARAICDAMSLPHPLRYVHEKERGIAHVRNRALREAEAGGADLIAFLDDDEIPTETWLEELLSTRARYSADAVCGPVLPTYSAGVPDWVKRGRFFDRPRFPTGANREFCGAGNVLIRREALGRVAEFDHRFQLTGGEDTQFFLRMHRAGCKLVWSQEAVVHEIVPAERATMAYILRRGYQSGNSWVLSELSFDPGWHMRVLRLAKACAHVVLGLLTTVPAALLGKTRFVKALRKTFLGAGMLSGLFGRKFLAYESPNGSAAPTAPELTGPTSA